MDSSKYKSFIFIFFVSVTVCSGAVVKRQAVIPISQTSPGFYDMTRVTTGYNDAEPTILNLKPKVNYFNEMRTQYPVGMNWFVEEFIDGKLVDSNGWNFDNTFEFSPVKSGIGLPLYPYRLDTKGTALITPPDQKIDLAKAFRKTQKRRKKRSNLIVLPAAQNGQGQRLYMVREQPGFRFKNYVNQQASGGMMLRGYRMDKSTGQMKSWLVGGDLRGGQNMNFDTGIDWPSQMIDLSQAYSG